MASEDGSHGNYNSLNYMFNDKLVSLSSCATDTVSRPAFPGPAAHSSVFNDYGQCVPTWILPEIRSEIDRSSIEWHQHRMDDLLLPSSRDLTSTSGMLVSAVQSNHGQSISGTNTISTVTDFLPNGDQRQSVVENKCRSNVGANSNGGNNSLRCKQQEQYAFPLYDSENSGEQSIPNNLSIDKENHEWQGDVHSNHPCRSDSVSEHERAIYSEQQKQQEPEVFQIHNCDMVAIQQQSQQPTLPVNHSIKEQQGSARLRNIALLNDSTSPVASHMALLYSNPSPIETQEERLSYNSMQAFNHHIRNSVSLAANPPVYDGTHGTALPHMSARTLTNSISNQNQSADLTIGSNHSTSGRFSCNESNNLAPSMRNTGNVRDDQTKQAAFNALRHGHSNIGSSSPNSMSHCVSGNTPASAMFTRVPLGEKGRMELKTAIRAAVKDRPQLRERVNAVAKLRCATIPQLLKIASICDLWYLALNISRRFMESRNGKQGGRGGRKSGASSSVSGNTVVSSPTNLNHTTFNDLTPGNGPGGSDGGMLSYHQYHHPRAPLYGDYMNHELCRDMGSSGTVDTGGGGVSDFINPCSPAAQIKSSPTTDYSNQSQGGGSIHNFASTSSLGRKRKLSVVKTGSKMSMAQTGVMPTPACGRGSYGIPSMAALSPSGSDISPILYGGGSGLLSDGSATTMATNNSSDAYTFSLSPVCNEHNLSSYNFGQGDSNAGPFANLDQPGVIGGDSAVADHRVNGAHSQHQQHAVTAADAVASSISYGGDFFGGSDGSAMVEYGGSHSQQHSTLGGVAVSAGENSSHHFNNGVLSWMNELHVQQRLGDTQSAGAIFSEESAIGWGILDADDGRQDEANSSTYIRSLR